MLDSAWGFSACLTEVFVAPAPDQFTGRLRGNLKSLTPFSFQAEVADDRPDSGGVDDHPCYEGGRVTHLVGDTPDDETDD